MACLIDAAPLTIPSNFSTRDGEHKEATRLPVTVPARTLLFISVNAMRFSRGEKRRGSSGRYAALTDGSSSAAPIDACRWHTAHRNRGSGIVDVEPLPNRDVGRAARRGAGPNSWCHLYHRTFGFTLKRGSVCPWRSWERQSLRHSKSSLKPLIDTRAIRLGNGIEALSYSRAAAYRLSPCGRTIMLSANTLDGAVE